MNSKPLIVSGDRLRVLVLHNIYWSHYKAAVFSELYNLCSARDVECYVIHMASTQDARAGMGGRDDALHRYPNKVLFHGSFNDLSRFRRSARLAREILRYKPHVIVVPGYDDIAWWVALGVGRSIGARIIAAVDSTFNDHPRHRVRELGKRLFLRQCDAVFGYGQRSREYCMFLGVPAEKVFVRCQATQNAIIRETYLKAGATALRPATFGYVGRLSEEKNVGLLIRAYQAIFADSDQVVPWRLLIIGTGPCEPALRTLAAATPKLPIEFAGGVSWREIPRRMRDIDVVVLPSSSEPWGLVVNEAMLCEKPVVVSQVCGCVPELVHHGRNGFVFDPNDLDALIAALKQFAANPELAASMGRQGLQIVSSYTPEAAAQQMLSGIAYVSGLPLSLPATSDQSLLREEFK